VVLDQDTIDKYKLDIFKLAYRLSSEEIDIFQFRFTKGYDKEILVKAKKISRIVKKRQKLFIVNNRIDIACLAEADGVHLGEEDIDVDSARCLLKNNKLIGRTIHSFKEYIKLPSKNNIDYISVGPIFKSEVKPQLEPISLKCLKKIMKYINIPLFAIGGINKNNLSYITSKVGIKNIAVGKGIILEKNIRETISKLRECLLNHF